MSDEPTTIDRLHTLVDEIGGREGFTDEHHRVILAHVESVADHIQSELDWEKSAHVHDVAHAWRDDPKANSFVCHDCGRALVNDMGTEPLLICPKLSGRRPPALKPKKANGAVECGQAGI